MTNLPCLLSSCPRCAWSAFLNKKEMYCTKHFSIKQQHRLRKKLSVADMPSESGGCSLYKRNSWRDNLRPNLTPDEIKRLERYYQ